jgi:hypothetical protein
MAQLSANTCNIVTLFPVEVESTITNASNPESTNGSIQLFVEGGTAPYYISWSNGQQGAFLNNLSPGDYTATVIDYYGDFTATTIQTVGYNSFYLDVFENCETSGSYVYYLAQFPSIFTTGKTYSLTTQTGCWEYTGTTLYSSQSYIEAPASILSGPFDDCASCLPTPNPVVTYPEYICLQQNYSPFTQYTFESGATINGLPSWSETGSTTWVMYYNTGNTRWEVSGFTPGNLVLNKLTAPPIGNWNQLGSDFTWTSISGVCGNQILSLSLNLSNPSCQTSGDGSILMVGSGGVPPYQYSLNGSIYQNSAYFANQNSGPGTAYMKDSTNLLVTQPYVLTNEVESQTYVVTINPSFTTPITTTSSSNKSMLYSIDVSPALSIYDTLTFDLTITNNQTFRSNASLGPSITTTISPLTTTGNVTINSSGVTATTGSATINNCDGYNSTSANTTTYNISINGPTNISGTINSIVGVPITNQVGCALQGATENQVSITNLSISSSLCNNVNISVPTATLINNKTGLISSVI